MRAVRFVPVLRCGAVLGAAWSTFLCVTGSVYWFSPVSVLVMVSGSPGTPSRSVTMLRWVDGIVAPVAGLLQNEFSQRERMTRSTQSPLAS